MNTPRQLALDEEARNLIHAFARRLVTEDHLLERLRQIAEEWIRLENERS